jgi:hypothetical protein
MILYEILSISLSNVYRIYVGFYEVLISLMRIGKEKGICLAQIIKKNRRNKMQNFVLAGKAKTIFRIIELKAKREEEAKRNKKQESKNKK